MLSTMKRLTLLLPLFYSVVADADWYLGADVGEARSDVDSAELNDRLTSRGLPGSARVDSNHRTGWRLLGGYRWGKYLALEGGYTDLGDIEASYSGTGPLSSAEQKAVYPASGSGYELSLLGLYPFSENLSGFVRGGLFAWHAEYSTNAGTRVSDSGRDRVFGLGGEWRVNAQWSLRLGWDRYTVARDSTNLISLGGRYRFGGQGSPMPNAERRE